MKQHDSLNIIPDQYVGKEIITEVTRSFDEIEEAKSFYIIARQRLLDVNHWHSLAGLISGQFYVTNESGEKQNRTVQTGDYVKIDIPGPGSSEGDGFDWVKVEELKEIENASLQSVGFRVRPSANPLKDQQGETAHFYNNEATSTFIVTRRNRELMVEILDLNLNPNQEISSVTDRIRNLAVGLGAIGLFSKVQWQNLAEGIIKE